MFMSAESKASYYSATSSISILLGHCGSPAVIVTDNEAALLKATKRIFPTANPIPAGGTST